MTVLKATFRTNDEQGPVEIKLTWHKRLQVYGGGAGYTVTATDKTGAGEPVGKYHESRRDIALRHAVHLFKSYENESNQRAIQSAKGEKQ